MSNQGKAETYYEDAKEILLGRIYYWKHWCFGFDQDTEYLHLHIWSEAAILKLWELSSYCWFDFAIDAKELTRYSDDSFKNFISGGNMLKAVRSIINSTTSTQPILSHSYSSINFGNWRLISRKEGEMIIHYYTDTTRAIKLQEDLFGFTLEFNGSTRYTFSAKTPLGAEFSTSRILGRTINEPESQPQSNLTSCSMLNKNNSVNGVTEIQCHAKARLHNISYVWNIDRFDLRRPVPTDNQKMLIKSPSFSSSTYDNIKWYLQINPRNKTSDKISLHLMFCPNGTQTRAYAQYSANFLDSKGKSMYTLALNELYTFIIGIGIGWNEIPINKVVTSDNTINVVCKIAVCEFTTNSFHLNRTDPTINSEFNPSQDIAPSTKNSEISDVVLILSKTGKKYPANKAKLAASSPVFAAMFNTSLTEKGKKIDRVNITDVDSEPVFDELLKYIYTSKCENIENLAHDLLVAAHKYELNDLKGLCVEKISNNLTVGSAVDTLNLAHEHGLGELKSKTIRFIAANYAKISNTTDWKHIVQTNSEFVHEVCQMMSNYLSMQ